MADDNKQVQYNREAFTQFLSLVNQSAIASKDLKDVLVERGGYGLGLVVDNALAGQEKAIDDLVGYISEDKDIAQDMKEGAAMMFGQIHAKTIDEAFTFSAAPKLVPDPEPEEQPEDPSAGESENGQPEQPGPSSDSPQEPGSTSDPENPESGTPAGSPTGTTEQTPDGTQDMKSPEPSTKTSGTDSSDPSKECTPDAETTSPDSEGRGSVESTNTPASQDTPPSRSSDPMAAQLQNIQMELIGIDDRITELKEELKQEKADFANIKTQHKETLSELNGKIDEAYGQFHGMARDMRSLKSGQTNLFHPPVQPRQDEQEEKTAAENPTPATAPQVETVTIEPELISKEAVKPGDIILVKAFYAPNDAPVLLGTDVDLIDNVMYMDTLAQSIKIYWADNAGIPTMDGSRILPDDITLEIYRLNELAADGRPFWVRFHKNGGRDLARDWSECADIGLIRSSIEMLASINNCEPEQLQLEFRPAVIERPVDETAAEPAAAAAPDKGPAPDPILVKFYRDGESTGPWTEVESLEAARESTSLMAKDGLSRGDHADFDFVQLDWPQDVWFLVDGKRYSRKAVRVNSWNEYDEMAKAITKRKNCGRDSITIEIESAS